ncbi:general glycosylation pathway protein [Thiothrix subterranea]|uniref:PDC sensor domain-containing protein n=1 Tax=Thiothrix subterranea TaxID=2735563 RepID=UPI00192B0646|nr:PDC sensor domain-containing protein [Thiothrix subterranea]QQZ27295.1 general glycosylation pathway protein [Thiothrix subterranea]
MSEMSYIQIIEHYHQHTASINELMGSILSGINDETLFQDEARQQKAIDCLMESYPFVDLLYTLDPSGQQLSHNVAPGNTLADQQGGVGKDRSHRPYFLQAKDSRATIVTAPYLSVASRSLCISAAVEVRSATDVLLSYIVLDIDLSRTIEFLMGDSQRRKFSVLFKSIYAAIALGLFSVVGLLFYFSLEELWSVFIPGTGQHELHYTKPFGIIVYLTLALAIFDLAKTTLEEEVLMHKDIFRHSSTRRTITRFMSAILIAVSIEALLLMFKSVLGDGHMLAGAVEMMFSAAALLVALGVYVFLGAKAEKAMVELRQNKLD